MRYSLPDSSSPFLVPTFPRVPPMKCLAKHISRNTEAHKCIYGLLYFTPLPFLIPTQRRGIIRAISTQSNHELRMSSPGSHLSVFKMADGGRFDSFYFNCRRIRDFSRLKAKDKSKVRKGRAHRSFPSCNATNDDLPWPASEDDASLVNEEDLDPSIQYASMSNLCVRLFHKTIVPQWTTSQ